MPLIQIYLLALALVIGMMIVLWLISLPLKNSSIVDIFWGFGFIITAWFYFFLTPDGFLPRKWLVVALVTLWGLRLSIYILLRNYGKPEDFRYAAWRAEAGGAWWWRSFFKVFLLQGLLLWVISMPLLAAQMNPLSIGFNALDRLGILLWITGFYFEATGDLQLARFKADPANKGRVLDSGVWRYTRHPNYFGDAAQWWGYFMLAAATGDWWTIYSPLIMTGLLLRVSGVTLLEKSLETRPGYKEYIQRTSPFIPWFPRKPQA